MGEISALEQIVQLSYPAAINRTHTGIAQLGGQMNTPAPIPLSCINYVKTIYPLPISAPVLGMAKHMCAAGVPRLLVALMVLEMIFGGSRKEQASEGEQKKWDRLTQGAMQNPPSSTLDKQMQKLEICNFFLFEDWEQALQYLKNAFPYFDQTLLARLYARASFGTALTKEIIDFEIAEHEKVIAALQALSLAKPSTPATRTP